MGLWIEPPAFGHGQIISASAYLYSANTADRRAWWNYLHPDPTVGNDDLMARTMLLANWVPEQASAPSWASYPLTKWLPDNGDGSSPGGMVMARTAWQAVDPDSLVVMLRAKYNMSNHQHYDPGQVSVAWRNKRFITDQRFHAYGDPDHGALCEHSGLVIDQRCYPEHDIDGNGSSDASDNSVMYTSVDNLAWDAGSTAALADLRYGYIDQSDYGREPQPKEDMTPAVTGERAVLVANFWQDAPAVVIYDRVQIDAATHTYALDWHFRQEISYSGDGSLAAPLDLADGSEHLRLWLPGENGTFTVTAYASADQGTSWLARTEKSAVATRFATLMLANSGAGVPAVIQTTLGGQTAYRLDVPGKSDRLYLVRNDTGNSYTVAGWTTNAEVALWGLAAGGAWQYLNAAGHTILQYNSVAVTDTSYRSTVLKRSGGNAVGYTSASRTQESLSVALGDVPPTFTPTSVQTTTVTPTATPAVTPTRTPTPTVTRTPTAIPDRQQTVWRMNRSPDEDGRIYEWLDSMHQATLAYARKADWYTRPRLTPQDLSVALWVGWTNTDL